MEEIEKEGKECMEERGRGDTVYRERERLGTVRASREEERMVEKVYKA